MNVKSKVKEIFREIDSRKSRHTSLEQSQRAEQK